MISQNGISATDLAYLLSADVPGVKVALSPELLNDAACCSALWIAVPFVPQSADSYWANIPEPPLGPPYNQVDMAKYIVCTVCMSHCQRGALALKRAPEKGEPLEIFALTGSRLILPGIESSTKILTL